MNACDFFFSIELYQMTCKVMIADDLLPDINIYTSENDRISTE